MDTPQQWFDLLQRYVRRNFFSTDTAFKPSLPGPGPIGQDEDYFYGSCLETPPGFTSWTDFSCDNGIRKIAYKGLRYSKATIPDRRRAAEINLRIADEQFSQLGPIAVLYSASFLEHYREVADPFLEMCPTPSTGTVSGTARFLDEGSPPPPLPVPDVTISLYDATFNLVAQTQTDAAGSFQFTVPPGTYFLEAFKQLGPDTSLFGDDVVVVTAGETTMLDILLQLIAPV